MEKEFKFVYDEEGGRLLCETPKLRLCKEKLDAWFILPEEYKRVFLNLSTEVSEEALEIKVSNTFNNNLELRNYAKRWEDQIFYWETVQAVRNFLTATHAKTCYVTIQYEE